MRWVWILLVASCCPTTSTTVASSTPKPEAKELATPLEQHHLQGMKQLTFGGDNAEAYWSFAGDKLIYQTNHKPYQCDQIEEMPSAGGPSKLVSTGKGRDTCSYFLKGDQEIIYASTDENSPSCPTPPDMSKGYYWGLFEYDIYRANADGSNRRKIAGAPGYDAEATVCPKDGSIIFTSERSGDLELWRMDADGGNLRQLTNMPGYDGGAFFSADCSKIVWRASRPLGKDLEEYKALLAQHLVKPTKMDLWVANADGTEAHQVTYLPGASFAPYFFPNGKRIIFGSNYQSPKGPAFDLFAIDSDGTHLERITDDPGFDSFPVFSPDGKTLSWSSGRRDVVPAADGSGSVWRVNGMPADKRGINVFTAQWVDNAAPVEYQPETAMADHYKELVDYLADDAREGRGIGTKGLADAADYVQKQLTDAGVEPGIDGKWRQTFEVVTDMKRGDKTSLAIDGKPVAADAFVPLAFSSPQPVKGSVVDMGWGITDEAINRDDYKGKNVKGKIVLVHRFSPPAAKDQKVDPLALASAGDLRKKAFVAHNNGAIGMIVVDDGDLKQEEAVLPTLSAESAGQHGDAGIPVVVVKRAAIPKLPHTAAITVELATVRAPTDNVIGVIRATSPSKLPGAIVLGAHLDHLGMGGGENALDPKVHAVHNGADDNASGVAALIEAAQLLEKQKGSLQRDIYIIAFSGEEEGDLGSDFFVKHADMKNVVAMINMDMVGRMRNNHLIVNGGESATEWRELVQPACDAARVECTIGGSGYGPSDHMSFYVAGVPVLFLFTGNHLDYHTATDDPDKINAAGGSRVAMIVADVAARVANRSSQLTYVKAPPEQTFGDIRHTGASLGTVPSYSEDPNLPPGLILSDVVPDGPAAKAGLKGGDRIIKVGTIEIRGINDLMFVLQTAKPGTETTVTFVRDGKQQSLKATFGLPRGRR
jgi:hypothetical protein